MEENDQGRYKSVSSTVHSVVITCLCGLTRFPVHPDFNYVIEQTSLFFMGVDCSPLGLDRKLSALVHLNSNLSKQNLMRINNLSYD